MLNNFVNFYRNLDKKFKVIFWVVFVDLIIIIALAIIFFIYRLNNEPRNITITNWDEYASEVPDGYKKSAEETITHILTNYNRIPEDITADATIRNSTYYANKTSSTDEHYKVGFIVDLESLEQSYKVTFYYAKNSKKDSDFQVEVACPSYTQIIYKNTKCQTSNTPFNEVLQYLTYLGYLPQSNTKFTIKKQTYSASGAHPKSPYLAVSVNSCDNTNIIQEAKEYIPVWLKERYLDPNDFYYEVFNTCEV